MNRTTGTNDIDENRSNILGVGEDGGWGMGAIYSMLLKLTLAVH